YQFELSPDGKTRLIYVSEGIEDLFGIAPEAAMADQRSLSDLIHPEDAKSYRKALQEAVAHLAPWHWVGRVCTSTDEVKWIHDQSKPATDERGNVRRGEDGSIVWDGIVIDVT